MEEWKACAAPLSKYSISSAGNIRNDRNGKLMKPSVSASGYYYFNATLDPQPGENKVKQRKFYVHKLMGEVFLQNPHGLPTVDHKDRDKLNNALENLAWASLNDQSDNKHHPPKQAGRPVDQLTLEGEFIKTWPRQKDAAEAAGVDSRNMAKHIADGTPYGGFLWRNTVDEKEGEEWRDVKVPGVAFDVQVSNLGRVRRARKVGWSVANPAESGGYLRVTLQQANSRPINLAVHRLVAQAFVENLEPERLTVVTHLDGDVHNNTLENLEWTTQQQTAVEAAASGKRKSRAVEQLDRITKQRVGEVHVSPAAAARAVDLKSSGGILKAAETGCTAAGYLWRYV